jgi:transposase
MLGENPSQPALFQMVDVESLVPANHRLRQINAALDLSFVREALADCYTPGRGRPSIDPELAVRMMILGVLYNLSDRQLCDEIRMHAGFRWFCRLNFHDPVPDHSTLSRLRNERWAESDLFTRLFEEILRSCAAAGLVAGGHVSVDGTQIKANASMHSIEARALPDKDVSDEDDSGDPHASGAAKEPQPEGSWQGHGKRYSNETHVSQTDPDARLYRKGPNQGARLSYLVHDLIDTKSRVILGRRASEAMGTAEREVALELLEEHEDRRERVGIGRPVEILSADAGYGVSRFVADIIDRGIVPHTPLQAGDEVEALPRWKRRTFNLQHYRRRREKVHLAQARNHVRHLMRTEGYAVSRKLRIRSEHVFAEAKNLHGLGRARHRGLEKVDRHAQLIAAVQNLKRLSRMLWRRAQGKSADSGFFEALLHALHSALDRFQNLGPIDRRNRRISAAMSPITAYLQLRQMAHCSTAF